MAARELTKLHEEFLRGPWPKYAHRLTARDRIRGEFILLIEAPASTAKSGASTSTFLRSRMRIQASGIDLHSG